MLQLLDFNKKTPVPKCWNIAEHQEQHNLHRHHLEVMIVWAIKNPAEAGFMNRVAYFVATNRA